MGSSQLILTCSSEKSDSSEEDCSDVTNWKLLAYSKQKARPAVVSSESEDGEPTSEQESADLYEESNVGAAGFFDDEAMEASLSSEEGEMEWESSAGSEEGDGGEGFILDEAEDENVHDMHKRKREERKRAVIVYSSEEEEEAEEEEEEEEEEDISEATTPPAVVDSTESDQDIGVGKMKKRPKLLQSSDEDGSDGSLEDESSDASSSSEIAGRDASTRDAGSRLSTEENVGVLKWKEGLSEKAKESYDHRKSSSADLRKMIYPDADTPPSSERRDGSELKEVVGGLFSVARKQERSILHQEDSSVIARTVSRDWTDPEVCAEVKSLFVTGNWGEESARTLLKQDDEMYGDFEDLETGERHVTFEEPGLEGKEDEQSRLKKKKSLKTSFDSEYDDGEGGSGGYLEDLKKEVSEQEERNRAEFEGMDDQTRVMYEGVRPGCYVRMEIKGSGC